MATTRTAAFLLTTFLAACVRGTPEVQLASATVDFGSVDQGSPAAPQFVVKNVGTAPLKIERINLTAPVRVVATKMPPEIAPGAEGTVVLSIETASIEGVVEGEVTLLVNDPATPEVHVALTGRVIPPIEITPLSAVFVSAGRGERAHASVEIVNHQDSPLSIDGIEHPKGRFTTSLETLEPGQRFRLTVSLEGRGAAGQQKDSLVLRTSSPNRPTLTIPVNTLVRERVYTYPETVDMGALPLGTLRMTPGVVTTLAQTLMVYRKGSPGFEVTASTDLPFLRVDAERGPDGDQYQLRVSLIADKVRPGPIRGHIIVQTNDREFPRLAIPVSGRILP